MRAIVPVAGQGTRLRPHTHTAPKVLLHVAGKPLLGHILDELRQAGIDVAVLLRESSDTRFIRRHVNNGLVIHHGALDDPGALRRSLKGAELVVHCAGKTKALSKREYDDANREGTRSIVGTANDTGRVERDARAAVGSSGCSLRASN